MTFAGKLFAAFALTSMAVGGAIVYSFKKGLDACGIHKNDETEDVTNDEPETIEVSDEITDEEVVEAEPTEEEA